MAVYFLGYIIGGEGFSQSLQIEFVLVKKDCHPASLFLTGGPEVLLQKSWRALPRLFHLWWRRNLKIYLEFYLFYKYIDGLSSPLSPAIWAVSDSCCWIWRMWNIHMASVTGGRKTFLSYGLYADLLETLMSYSTFKESYCILRQLG